MMSEKERYEQLAVKWLEGTITDDEKKEFMAWYNSHDDEKAVLPVGFADSDEELEERIFLVIKQLTKPVKPLRTSMKRRVWSLSAAAIVLALLALGLYQWYVSDFGQHHQAHASYDVAPGRNRAALTFADGRLVELSETEVGIVLREGMIQYAGGDKLLGSDAAEGSFIQMTTPKGGRYQVTLADGTMVWLNSATTLRYPPQFTGGKRIVELDGEAYFEVAEDRSSPFVVKCNGQEVQVLGTAFNINAYTDEEATKTTLVHGRVRITNEYQTKTDCVLRPGQQAILQGTDLVVVSVDTDEAIAWKDGYFQFNDTDMRSVMRQFSRWYDIDVSYESDLANPTFGGRLPMDMTLKSVLNILSATGVNFEIKEDRQLVVKLK